MVILIAMIEDDALAFFQEMVEPTVAEFLTRPDDRRRGCVACLSVEGSLDADAFRRSVSGKNWAVGQVIGVANATKHVQRRPGRVGYQDVSVQEINAGNLRCGWPINGTEVMIEVKEDELWLLSDLVEEAVNFWRLRLDSGS
jgi:hypothetical protein